MIQANFEPFGAFFRTYVHAYIFECLPKDTAKERGREMRERERNTDVRETSINGQGTEPTTQARALKLNL